MYTKGKLKIEHFTKTSTDYGSFIRSRLYFQDTNQQIDIALATEQDCGTNETKANAARLCLCWNTHDELLAACKEAGKLIVLARQYFPKSIKNSDKFQLETTCAAIGKAIAVAESEE